jgi:VWFA-related protein
MPGKLRGTAGALALALVAFGAHGDAQQTPAPQQGSAAPADQQAPGGTPPNGQQPVFRAGVNFVRVDVIVSSRNGAPITNLTQNDFEVLEDGKPQTIQTFKLIHLDGGVSEPSGEPPRPIRTDEDEQAEAARDDVRLFGIFLDDYHVRRESSMRVRDELAQFVKNQLGPSDMVGIMYPLESLDSVRMTRDHAAIETALKQFVGRKYDYDPKNAFEEKYADYPTETVERIRVQVALSALKAFIIHLGGLKEARKALVLVSEGYTYMVPPQMRSDNAQVPNIESHSSPLLGVNDPNEQLAGFMADSQLDDDLRDIYNTANRNNVAIYAIDPRGLAGSDFDIQDNINPQTGAQYLQSTQNTLRSLSEETEGRAIVNRNDLEPGLKQIVRDESAYYLIGYDSSSAPTDGKFHQITVRVKRKDVQVRARSGYWAITPENAARLKAPAKPAPPPGVTKALVAVDEPVRARVIDSWLGTSRGANGKTKVTFVWRPTARPSVPGRPVDADEMPAQVSIMAVGDDGAPYYRGRVPEQLPKSGSTAQAGARVSFEAPPGPMHLRLEVDSADQSVLDTEIRDVTVPDLTASDTVFGTPAVFRARTFLELQKLKGDPQAVPSVARTFSRTESLLVRVPVYAAATPAVTARLLNREGDPMEDLKVEAGPAFDAPSQIEVPLASFAPGDYVMQISASAAGGKPASEFVGFRVTN